MTDHQPLTLIMQQATLSRAQTRWVRLGFFQSIQPTIVYQPGKANILEDALSRSKRVELDAIHSMMANGDPEEEITVMTRSSIVATEEVKIWRTAQEEDPIVQDIIQRVRQRQVRSAFALTPQGLLVQEDDGQRKLVVPTSMRQKVMASCHDEPTKGHTGIYRTTELVKQRYWWKGMGKDIENYVKSCPVCQVMKSDHRKKVGPLQPIPIPTRKWEQITTDLVTDLPPSAGYTAIAVFVDRLTKMVHFAPCTKEISADQYAQLFVDNVFRLHGTPEVIISDRDPRFTSRFWTQFFQILATDLRLSTAFHPQTDGQSEVTIRVLKNFLRLYVELHPYV